MKKITQLTNKIKSMYLKFFPKKHHWFEVRYIYNFEGRMIFNYVEQIGLSDIREILNRRVLKKIIPPLHRHKNIRKYLRNGNLDIEIICSLGYFAK